MQVKLDFSLNIHSRGKQLIYLFITQSKRINNTEKFGCVITNDSFLCCVYTIEHDNRVNIHTFVSDVRAHTHRLLCLGSGRTANANNKHHGRFCENPKNTKYRSHFPAPHHTITIINVDVITLDEIRISESN